MTEDDRSAPVVGDDRSHIGLGIASILLGLAAGWIAWGYGIGTLTEMGPGFFPLAASVALVGLGLAVILRGGRDIEPPSGEDAATGDAGAIHALRVLGAVFGGILLFALTIQPLGLFISVFLLTVVCSLGHPGPKPVPVVLLAVGLAIASVLIFVVALNLQLHTWPRLG